MIATHSMQNLVANFSGRTRRERVGGRDYIVAPLTMLVPSVLEGSQGSLFYPADEIEASTHYWEGMILTDNHLPNGVNGRHLSTQEQYSMGVIQNPVFNKGRLQAEGWFDVERTRRINPQVLSALQTGQRIELSTGLGVDYDDKSGIHNGRYYNRIARNYRPDHLAILVNNRGACSLTDGCGVNNCGNDSPAGGSLGSPAIDWGTTATSSPTITSRFNGGGLPHTEIVWDQQPQPEREQPSRPTYEHREGPAGGALGPAPTPTY